MIGYKDSHTKAMINLGSTVWSLINGTAIAILSPRYKRRTMFLTGAIGMLAVYIGWTIASQQAVAAIEAGKTNKAAGIAVLVFVYWFSPWYNIGNNALAYSKFFLSYLTRCFPTGKANIVNQHTWWNSSPTPNVRAGSPSSNSQPVSLASSPPSSTPSEWIILGGNIYSCISSPSLLKLLPFGSSTLRLKVVH